MAQTTFASQANLYTLHYYIIYAISISGERSPGEGFRDTTGSDCPRLGP